MNNKLINIRLRGHLGRCVGRSWNLSVSSVKEAIHAINTLSNNRFNNYFINNNKLQAKYRVLINGRDFTCPVKKIDESNIEMINQSELIMKKDTLETIDIVPFFENYNSKGGGIGSIIVGVILIIVGVIVAFFTFGAGFAIAIAGLGILGAGISILLSLPPGFGKDDGPDKSNRRSYLFSGPINLIGEGGPVPVGYGRVLVGSQVISSAFQVSNYSV